MQKIPGQKRNDKNDIRTPKKGNLSSCKEAGQPSGKSDSWTLSGKTEKDFCSKMFKSTRTVPQAIGARKNGSNTLFQLWKKHRLRIGPIWSVLKIEGGFEPVKIRGLIWWLIIKLISWSNFQPPNRADFSAGPGVRKIAQPPNLGFDRCPQN